jgi:hypothetical protein
MYRSTSPGEKNAFSPERPESFPNLGMKNRVVPRIKTDNRCWWSTIGKHPPGRRDGIVMPVKCWVFLYILEPMIAEERNNSPSQA